MEGIDVHRMADVDVFTDVGMGIAEMANGEMANGGMANGEMVNGKIASGEIAADGTNAFTAAIMPSPKAGFERIWEC